MDDGWELYIIATGLIADYQNLNNEVSLAYDLSSVDADEFPYSISTGTWRLIHCYAANYVYEGMFGNNWAVELANEGFWKLVKDWIWTAMTDKWDPTKYHVYFGNETTIAALLAGFDNR